MSALAGDPAGRRAQELCLLQVPSGPDADLEAHERGTTGRSLHTVSALLHYAVFCLLCRKSSKLAGQRVLTVRLSSTSGQGLCGLPIMNTLLWGDHICLCGLPISIIAWCIDGLA